jgi:hypothetical protein
MLSCCLYCLLLIVNTFFFKKFEKDKNIFKYFNYPGIIRYHGIPTLIKWNTMSFLVFFRHIPYLCASFKTGMESIVYKG